MHSYRIQNRWLSLLTPEVVSLLTKIYEHRGKFSIRLEYEKLGLETSTMMATFHSTISSLRLDGLPVSEDRCHSIVLRSSLPSSTIESSIGGYVEALQRIGDNYVYLPVKPTSILEIHRALNHYCDKTLCGRFRQDSEVAESIARLCDDYHAALAEGADTLLITALFMLHFLRIRPFDANNGLMSRLVTLLLLYRAGDTVVRYVSLEKIIERRAADYLDAISYGLKNSNPSEIDEFPFVKFFLETLLEAYGDFEVLAERLKAESGLKSRRIREVIRNANKQITKAEIMKDCPDISQITIQRSLNELMTQGMIEKISGGRYTKYCWIGEE